MFVFVGILVNTVVLLLLSWCESIGLGIHHNDEMVNLLKFGPKTKIVLIWLCTTSGIDIVLDDDIVKHSYLDTRVYYSSVFSSIEMQS